MAELKETKIELRFIMCADCLYKVVGALQRTDGVVQAKHNPATYPPWVWVQYDPTKLTLADIERVIEQTGYQIKGKKYPGLWESIRALFQRS